VIGFTMPVTGYAKVEVFNVLGRLIATPFDGTAQAGQNQVIWDGRDSNGEQTASGVYLYRLTADKYTETKKMMLLK
jgi:flagellar hook assembly protein FlgD